MADKSLFEYVKSAGLKRALRYIESDPDKNFPKLLAWMDRFDRHDTLKAERDVFRKIVNDPTNNWYQLAKKVWTEIDDDVRKTFFENFVINANVIGPQRRKKAEEQYDCKFPWAILMDPTSACNLHCVGCWAAEYGNKLNMDLETLDSIIKQGKENGTYMYIYSGGEPLIRKKDIITLCERHPECEFLAFTNATLIDEQFADAMLRVRNFVPAISVEGFEEETDKRRGKGTYRKIMKAMDILRERKLIFGISSCYTRDNAEVVGSEEYFDAMIEKGAKFAWFFTYIPVGVDAVPELLVTADQRKYMYHQVRKFRQTKPIFTMDFWNDGEFVNGCIAGARKYLHINAAGDIEPCAFIHYSDSNIHEKTLLEAYRSPLFRQYQKNQPFNENHLRPCPLLDNKGALAKIVDEVHAKSTDLEHPEAVHDLTAKCAQAADNWEPVAEQLWSGKKKHKTA